MRILIALCFLAIFAVNVSLGSWYFGGSVGRSDVDFGISSLTGTAKLNEDDIGYKVVVGRQLNDIFSLEGHYADFGTASLTGNSGDTFFSGGTRFTFTGTGSVVVNGTGYSASALARLPIDGRVKPFARLGYHFWEFDMTATSAAGGVSASDDGTGLFFGGGFHVKLTELVSARAEFERFDFGGDDVDFLSFGLIIRFPKYGEGQG